MAEKVSLKDKTVMCIDCGLFVEIAIKLSKEFKKVYYYTEWRSSFPSKKGVMIGEGYKEIERVNDWMSKIDEVDLFVFPDVYYGSEQAYLRSIGKNVFGGGHGDDLELWRNEAKKHFKSLGLPVSPYKVVVGLDKLREYLKTKKNQFVKISCYRGDFETWHHEEYRLSEPMLDRMEKSLGVMKDDYEFIVESALDGEDIVEAGSDLFTVDGKYPDKVISGFEIKDLGYVGAVKDYDKISPLVTGFNNKIASTLKKYTYRGFMSTEIRVGKDKVPYMIDFCFSDDTEVYTDKGWKLFKDLDKTELIWSADLESGETDFQKPIRYIEQDYSGFLYKQQIVGSEDYILITENHHTWCLGTNNDFELKYIKLSTSQIENKIVNIPFGFDAQEDIAISTQKHNHYEGKVYCVEVPNGTLYVRRNGKPFWSSNCARAGSPPNELYQELISNLGEVMWYAAQGILVQPKYAAKYGIECLIHSDWASDNWQAVYFPKEINQWVKLRNACRINGIDYVVPQSDGLPEIGAVIAIGDSVDECIEKVKEYSEQVKGYRLDIKTGSIENMKEVMERAAKLGIKID